MNLSTRLTSSPNQQPQPFGVLDPSDRQRSYRHKKERGTKKRQNIHVRGLTPSQAHTLSRQSGSPGSPTTARPRQLADSLVEDDDFYTAPPPHSPSSEASSSSSTFSRPPPFSSLFFPPVTDPNRPKVSESGSPSLPALGPPPPLEEPSEPEPSSSIVAETKASLSRDQEGERSGKSPDDGEPPPPYTEGSSPIDSFTYVMAAAGGASSIITQVQQGGPPINTLGGTRATSKTLLKIDLVLTGLLLE